MAGKESNKTKQELRAMQSDVVPEPTAPELVLPVFWDGKSPIGLGMALKQEGYTVIVTNIFNCINGAVVVGQTLLNGEAHNVHVSRPAPHKLAAWPRETPEQEADLIKYWGYDIQ